MMKMTMVMIIMCEPPHPRQMGPEEAAAGEQQR
jgi:hypothetical protein